MFDHDERFRPPSYDACGHFADAHRWHGAVDDPIEPGFTETCGEWRMRQWREADSHVEAWRASAPYQARPFRFEDLNGRSEPASWGPCYPKTACAAVEKWRAIARGRDLTAIESETYGAAVHDWIRSLNKPKRAPDTLSTRSNSASGQATEFNAAKHRASLKARLHAQAASDRLAWATGQRDYHGDTIEKAYARAMADKRARLAALELDRAA